MKIWHILVAVGAGVVVGLFEPGKFTYAFGQVTLYVFLPALLFEASWNINYRAMRRQWLAIATLAGPGVLLTALIVAGALSVVGVPLAPALLTGAILSATDPLAIVAVFRRLRIPKTLATIVESESLLNDAVAVVLYRAIVLAIAMGALDARAIGGVSLLAIGGSIGGIAFGIVFAWAAAIVLRRNRDARVQIVATVLCAYGSYFVADYLHLSGIFATIACGIALRYFERSWITLSIVADVNAFWDVAAPASNALVFFLVGAALQIGSVVREPIFVAAALVAIALSRAAVAGLLLPFGYPRPWLGVVRIAGMRGALSLALAIALPASIPYRQAIVDATFAVALATLLASSLTVARVARRAVQTPSG